MKRKARFRFNPFALAWRFILNVYHLAQTKVGESLRLQLILTFSVCLVAAVLVTAMSNSLFDRANRHAYIDYNSGEESIDSVARDLARQIQDKSFPQQESETGTAQQQPDTGTVQQATPQVPSPPTWPDQAVQGQQGPSPAAAKSLALLPLTTQETISLSNNFNDESAYNNNLKILLIDQDGKVLIKSRNVSDNQVDLHSSIIEDAMNTKIDRRYDSGQAFTSIYPVNLGNFKGYLVASGFPQASLRYSSSPSFTSFINGLGAFIILFFLLTRRKMRYLENLAGGLLEIAKGDLAYRVEQKSKDELGSLAHNINHMAAELQTKIEAERQAERTKHELITNVSHDLRTPLTSIMGYLRLLKDNKYEGQAQLASFVDIAYGKSEQLQGLIEDLFEYTKLHNDEAKFEQEKVSLNELLGQLLDEMVPLCEENQLIFDTDIPQAKVMATLDVAKTVRALENLLTNAIKYSYKPGRIGVKLSVHEDTATISLHNRGTPIPPEDLANLFDRFYRVEKSRSTSTGGSGLGLAIAKNIIEAQDGQIWAESQGEDISFHVRLRIS